ncbi:MAG: flagellar hook-basal body complex protein [Phycisphaerales bacterium]|nr:flagellar hook-basal body complex protein [Phycisphaerales bacterium]
MGLTSAMYTGLSGINVNQTRINTIGNNIANVNTTAFKASRTLFQTQFFRTSNLGTRPNATTGGVNPMQVGLGAVVGATQRDHTPGSIETTGIGSDLAIEGDGFFVLNTPGGRQVYSRDGSFSLDANNRLVSIDGNAVMGFGVDQNFTLQPNVLSEIAIPLGTLSIAQATQNVNMDGDLSGGGTIATQGAVSASQALIASGGGAATGSTALTSLQSASNPGTNLFASGDTITVDGVTKGGRSLPPATFTVGTDGSTLDDFAAWLQTNLGIQTDATLPGSPGVTVSGGQLVVSSNAGEANAIVFTGNDFLSSSTTAPQPLLMTQTQSATGSGVSTSFTVYDSLGSPLIVQANFALDSTPNTGPVWRYYLESADQSGGMRSLGSGTVSFDTLGNFVAADGNQFSLDINNTGALTPLTFQINFNDVNGLSTAESNVIAASQDGFPPGTLSGFGVGADGVITGAFSNGMTQTLGQVAVAMFSNPQGLIAANDNLYELGPNSGEPRIVEPEQFGAGAVLSGALELSNVDLSREFIGLITSSTGFQASSRVISTSSDLLDQLLLIAR